MKQTRTSRAVERVLIRAGLQRSDRRVALGNLSYGFRVDSKAGQEGTHAWVRLNWPKHYPQLLQEKLASSLLALHLAGYAATVATRPYTLLTVWRPAVGIGELPEELIRRVIGRDRSILAVEGVSNVDDAPFLATLQLLSFDQDRPVRESWRRYPDGWGFVL